MEKKKKDQGKAEGQGLREDGEKVWENALTQHVSFTHSFHLK